MAWELPPFQIPFISCWLDWDRSSRIPQFILDTQHPWILANADQLSKLPNPMSALCGLAKDAPLRSDASAEGEGTQPAGGIGRPADLFHELTIDNNRFGVSRYGWSNARDRLAEMKACPRALEEVRELKVDIYVYLQSPWGYLGTESRLPPRPLRALFAEVLGSMKNLKKLDWMVRYSDENAAIAKAFVDSGTELSSVEQLTTTMAAPWLVDACASVTYLAARRDILWQDYRLEVDEVWIKAAGRLKGLKRLNLGDVVWKDGMAKLIVNETPSIEELWVGSPRLVTRYPGSGEEGKMLRDLVAAFTALPNLKLLHLPKPADLGLGFDIEPECGEAYFDEVGDEAWQYYQSQAVRARKRAGNIVREVFPRLKGVYIEGYYGNFTTDEGNDVIIWT